MIFSRYVLSYFFHLRAFSATGARGTLLFSTWKIILKFNSFVARNKLHEKKILMLWAKLKWSKIENFEFSITDLLSVLKVDNSKR